MKIDVVIIDFKSTSSLVLLRSQYSNLLNDIRIEEGRGGRMRIAAGHNQREDENKFSHAPGYELLTKFEFLSKVAQLLLLLLLLCNVV